MRFESHLIWALAFCFVGFFVIAFWAGNEGSKRSAELQKLCIEQHMSWETLRWGGPACVNK